MNHNDLRFVKTEENLKKALLRLLETHHIEIITIKELCTKAKCSRNAFYQHYETKYDLYNSILNDILNTIEISTRSPVLDIRLIGEQEIQKFTYRYNQIVNELYRLHRKYKEEKMR